MTVKCRDESKRRREFVQTDVVTVLWVDRSQERIQLTDKGGDTVEWN